jgi:hypothetical protein
VWALKGVAYVWLDSHRAVEQIDRFADDRVSHSRRHRSQPWPRSDRVQVNQTVGGIRTQFLKIKLNVREHFRIFGHWS